MSRQLIQLPHVSLHAATRSAQSRGEHVDERDVLNDPALHARSRHHVIRLFLASTPVGIVDGQTAVFVNRTRTRVLVVIESVVVTVIPSRVESGFKPQKLHRLADALRERRTEPRHLPWWVEAERLAMPLAA